MTKKTREETRLYLEAFLLDAISNILESCQTFLINKDLEDTEKSKEFLDFHKACKVAISNLESILKLYKEFETQEENVLQKDEINQIIKEANAFVEQHDKSFLQN